MEICRRCKINKIDIKYSKPGKKYCSLCDYYINNIKDDVENNIDKKAKTKNKINCNPKEKINNFNLNLEKNKIDEINQYENIKISDNNYYNNNNYLEEYNQNYNNNLEYKNLYLIERKNF